VELLTIAIATNGYEIGDVIDIRPDGHNWGSEEMTDPIFNIIQIPDVDVGSPTASAAIATFLGSIETRRSRWKIVGTDLTEYEDVEGLPSVVPPPLPINASPIAGQNRGGG